MSTSFDDCLPDSYYPKDIDIELERIHKKHLDESRSECLSYIAKITCPDCGNIAKKQIPNPDHDRFTGKSVRECDVCGRWIDYDGD